jgi:hypothetical protein
MSIRKITRSKGAPSAQLKSCFTFAVSQHEDDAGQAEPKPFHDPVGLQLLRDVSEGLQRGGFQCSAVKRGRACDAGLTVSFEKFGVSVILLAKRRSGQIKLAILTWIKRPLWRSLAAAPERDWVRVCEAIEKVLREHSKVNHIERLARSEAERRAF